MPLMLVFIVEKPSAKTLGHETLRCQVITLVKVMPADDVKDARVTLQTRRVEHNLIQQVSDPGESSFRIFESYAPDQTVNLVA